MNTAAIVAFTLAGLMTGATVLLVLATRRAAYRDQIAARLGQLVRAGAETGLVRAPARAVPMLWRAGLEPTPWYLPAAVAALAVLAGGGWLWRGPLGLLVLPLGAAVITYLWLSLKAGKRRALMLSQLPLYLDQLLRALGTGRSMEGAFSIATTEARAPLKEVMEQVERTTALGADIAESVAEAADTYEMNELHMLALSVRINRTYGSSARELLQGVVNLVQRQERARRELRAMTGETRASAWVLGLLPPAMAVYMVAMNPGYLESMWDDPTGRIVLLVAVSLQITGSIILWRMVKSI